MNNSPTEFQVYSRLIDYLKTKGFTIICASPPAGTDMRYRKCLLPRRDLEGSERGPRDEVDLTAHNDEVILLIECKSSLSDSLSQLNALSESDYVKLKRISNSFSSNKLSELLSRAIGVPIPKDLHVILILAVGLVNAELPDDTIVIEFASEKPRIWVDGQIKDDFI